MAMSKDLYTTIQQGSAATGYVVEFAKHMNPPEDDGLTEYRCSCGRILGRFSGRAEIKCPKCRKVNVIGEEWA